MLTVPLMLMGRAEAETAPVLDYPKLKTGDAIADAICWLVMPDLFSKDNHQAQPTLIGSGELTEAGLKTSDLASGAKWPQPSDIGARVSDNQSYSIIWRGNLEAVAAWGSFVSIPWHDNDWANPFGWLRLIRDSSQARLATMFAKNSTTFDSSNYSDDATLQTGQHLYAVTYDGSVIKFYRDNSVIGSIWDSSGIASSGWTESDIFLCVNQEGFGEGIKAHSIDLCLIADRALTASEIAAIHADRMQLLDPAVENKPSYDYPAINASHSIGADVVWIYDASYTKDSQETEVTLSGNATHSQGELVIQDYSGSGTITFASGFDLSHAVNHGFTYLWEGRLENWGADAEFLKIRASDGSTVGSTEKHPTNDSHYVRLFDLDIWGWNDDGTTRDLVLFDGTLHHYIWTWNGSSLCSYRDGVLFGCRSIYDPISNGALIASVKLAADLDGAVKRAAILQRSISDTEAAELYNNPGSFLLN